MTMLWNPAVLLACWMAAMSLAAFAAMAIDKRRAVRGAWRIPEARLFLWALLGGGPGALLGMLLLRHKTRHLRFAVGFRLLSLCQLAGLVWLFLRCFRLNP